MKPAQEQFAKAVLLGQRIYLNSQAMLSLLSRTHNLNKSENMSEKLYRSLSDFHSCLSEFEEITKIQLNEAHLTLDSSQKALKNEDFSALYETIQKLYRDDYLKKIIELAKQ
jgi:hypothetical protein